MTKILLTGAAGFIGFHVAKRLLDDGREVLGLDNLSDYYSVELKRQRLARLEGRPGFSFVQLDIADRAAMEDFFRRHRPGKVIHLAAQAGVRYSLENPHAYADSNLVGFLNILEGCRRIQVEHLLYASSSSVYGANTRMPFSVRDNVDHPVSLYAATKKANELMAHAYSWLYRLPATGLRFFTVYGPWGRPDMAMFLFTRAILQGEPIDVYNEGRMRRDFTYIDDAVEAVIRLVDRPPSADHPSAGEGGVAPAAPCRVWNIGNHQPVELLEVIRLLEACLGKQAQLQLLPMQAGDVPATYADIEDLAEFIGFRPQTPIGVGIARFVDWFRSYYGPVTVTSAAAC